MIFLHKRKAAGVITPPASLVTTGLVNHHETTNPVLDPDGWDDLINGNTLYASGSTNEGALIAGGMPLGQDYFEFTNGEGFHFINASGWGLPGGSDARSMFALYRASSAVTPNYQPIAAYGRASSNQAFQLQIEPTGELAIDSWSTHGVAANSANDDLWHVAGATYAGAGGTLKLFMDATELGFKTDVTLNTDISASTGRVSVNERLNANAGAGLDLAAWLIYDRELNSTEVSQVTAYLRNKYLGS